MTVVTNNYQIGQSALASQNFVLGPPAVADGTLKLQRGNPDATTQDILTVDATGKLISNVPPATGTRSAELATMQKFADEFSSLQTTNGWQRLPSGLLVQWGNVVYVTAGSAQAVNYNIAFTSGAFFVIAGLSNNVAPTAGAIDFVTASATQATLRTTYSNVGIRWLAIGS